MKPPPFSYHAPTTLADAIALLGRLDNAKLMAGGQSLMPMLNMRFVQPDHVIDLNRIDGLAFIREANGALEVGAMTRQRDLEFSDLVRRCCPLLSDAVLQIGHRQTRNRGTLGGSLCHLDPAAELVSVATALDATVTMQGPNGARDVAFGAFPVAFMTPAVEPNEIVTAVRFPLWPQPHGYAFVEFARRHGDFAILSAAALLTEDGSGKITRATVTLGGMSIAPIRVTALEQALLGNRPDDTLLRELCESCRKFEAIDDVHAPAAYRQQLAAVLSRRALEQARARLPSGATATAHKAN